MRKPLLATVLFAVAALQADTNVRAQQPSAPADPLAPLSFLIGRWRSTSEGDPGKGSGEREYTRVLGNRFVQAKNRAVYLPQQKNPTGETHEDVGLFSYDRSRKRIVLRQFHTEGFVNQYVMEPGTPDGPVVFTSESIENIPAGFRARETYRRIGSDECEEVFEIAEPGSDFAVYSQTRLTRVK